MKSRKRNKLIRLFASFLFIVIELMSLILITYSIILYKNVETFYRCFAILILVYFFFFLSYLLLRSIKLQSKKSILIPVIVSIIISSISFGGYYYLSQIYSKMNQYGDSKNMYYSLLVTYNTELNSEKDLKNMKIGIINDTNDIIGNILPNETIKSLKLNKENKIVEYESYVELLHALKNKKINAAWLSKDYVENFSGMDGFEKIKEETKVLYTAKKEYNSKDEDIKSETASLDKPFSMLLIGVDSETSGVTSGVNADVLLLVTFNPETLRATLTSIPRDMYIKTACSNGNYRRINTTTLGSAYTCAVETVENLFDVNIDYYAKINFKGVVKLVNAVGGIDVKVDYSICEQNSSRKWGNKTVFVEKGNQHLNGEQALALARNRHKPNDGSYIGDKMAQYCPTYNKGTRNDFTRGKNQMKIIMGIANAAVKTKDPNKLLSIMDSIKKNFQTNITSKDILKLYNLAKSMVISDSTNLVNIERLQLAGYNVNVTGGITIFDPVLGKYKEDYGYPQVTIPYKGSIEDIKDAIKNNLNNTSIKAITKISFDIDNPYTITIIGDKTYKEDKVTTLKNLSSYSLDEIRTYASKNGLSVKFIDKDTNKEINDLDSYTFSSQKEHVYTILDQIDTLTIYVKQKITYNEQIEETQSTE